MINLSKITRAKRFTEAEDSHMGNTWVPKRSAIEEKGEMLAKRQKPTTMLQRSMF